MEGREITGVLDEKYYLLNKVGKECTSSVYLGYEFNRPAVILYAIKTINAQDRNSELFVNEVEMLKMIDHKNVVNIIDGAEGYLRKSNGKNKFVCYLVLEYIKCGDLFDFIMFPQRGFGKN